MLDAEYLERRRDRLPRNSDGSLAYTLTSIFPDVTTANYAQKVFDARPARHGGRNRYGKAGGFDSGALGR